MVTINNNKGYGNGILEGLKVASGEILAWTHADLQADPADVLKGYQIFASSGRPEQLFVKGKRYGRRLIDVFFTMGMAVSETIFLRKLMWDINAQPTMFHRQFFLSWKLPPDDFSLDLYAYYMAKHSGLLVQRFPVHFGERIHGTSHWNTSLKAKYRFIKRTLIYSYKLKQTLK